MKLYWDGNDNYRYRLFPVEISQNNSDRVCDLMICKNQYILNESLHEFLGKYDCTFVCTLCLSS